MDYLKDLNKKQVDAKSIIEELLSGKKYYFAELKPSDLEVCPGVYAIFDKDSGENLYVGRTKNLRQRLYTNHLMGSRDNARLKKYLVEDPDPCMSDIVSMDDAKQFLHPDFGFVEFLPTAVCPLYSKAYPSHCVDDERDTTNRWMRKNH